MAHFRPVLVAIERLQLHPSRRGRAPRRPSAALLELTRRHGPLQPVLARPLGQRRFEILGNVEVWLAAQACGFHDVPVEPLDDIDDAAALEILESERAADPITEARRFRRLVEEEHARRGHGAVTRVARQCGVRRSRVAHALRLLALPVTLRRALAAGELSAGHARALLRCPDAQAQAALARRVMDEGLSVRATEAAARARATGQVARAVPAGNTAGAGSAPAARSPDVVRLERQIAAEIGSAVVLDEAAGTLTIDYRRSLDVLDGLLERLGVRLE